ncbi:MAG: gamma-glutamylcyclotransferase [Deltaproteobacteria bacterium]|nr:gamma-glutamylcyclotransferase [Deltaproteobacteria bacterium]
MQGDDELLWYFAYGSNLDPGTFLGRRRMRPSESCTAILRGYRLVFDLPIGDGERGCANVVAAPDALIHGVAYRLTAAEARRLDATEGVPRAYQRLDVELERSGGETLAAFTYLSSFRRGDCKPSERYLNLLLAGARHHGLPQEWIDWLRGLELAVDERSTQLELFAARAAAESREVTSSATRLLNISG